MTPPPKGFPKVTPAFRDDQEKLRHVEHWSWDEEMAKKSKTKFWSDNRLREYIKLRQILNTI